MRLLTPLAVVAALAAGVWFLGAVVAATTQAAILLGIAWFVVCCLVSVAIGRARPELRAWLAGTLVACAAAGTFGFWWTTIRETEVNETVATGIPASRVGSLGTGDPLAPQPERAAAAPRRNVVVLAGSVQARAHSASGRARVVKLARGGRRLTLSDGFRIDPGPKVRVYLATDRSGARFVSLGGLKGSKGTQQYTIPASTSLARYDTVVFWCVPFSVALASAELKPA